MPLTIARLRLGIVALAALLLLTIVASFFYGRWRLRHIAQDLPARLGIQIEQSTRGFVLSQSNAQGRNLFTLHAARAIKFKSGGRVSLHDVKIDLYNRNGGPPDTIAGDDFEYDPRGEIVQSHGVAHIVLQGAQANKRSGASSRGADQPIRLTTHDLIFNRKTGVATCNGEVDFATSDASGQAMGAIFDSKLGHLLLASNVMLAATMHNHPATLHASRASYDRNQGRIDLVQPRYTSATRKGEDRGAAAAASIFLRADNSAERLDARGGMQLVTAAGMSVRAPAMQVLLNKSNQPRQANFSGGVAMTADQRGLDTRGDAQQSEVDFDSQGHAHRMVMDGKVQFLQQAGSAKNAMQRTLAANHLVLNLLPGANGQARLQSANATGSAVFTSQSAPPGPSPQKTTLAAEVLNTTFSVQNQPEHVDGAGQTRLQMMAANGDIDTSTGDMLQIEFAPPPSSTPARRQSAAEKQGNVLAAQSIRSAVQTGHVVLRQVAKEHRNGASGARISTATAERASYVGANNTLTLTGEPVFQEGQIELGARRIDVERTTGNVTAVGTVEATMASGDSQSQGANAAGGLLGGTQPVHIVAERAILLHEMQKAVFSGGARLWQGENTIQAPVIELSQKQQTFSAYGPPSCASCVVSNFPGASTAPGSQPAPAKGAVAATTYRILSQRLNYSDAERKATFLHHVQLIGASGRMTADRAEVFLAAPARHSVKATPSGAQRSKAESTGPSSVEKIIATGNVRLWQPGRIASGGRLIYTAADGDFVLTGNENNPPEVTDRDRGTITGQVLTFASRDQAIMVSGASGHTTTSRTRVQQK